MKLLRWLLRWFEPTVPADVTMAALDVRLLRSVPLFVVSPELIAALSVVREARGHDSITLEHGAFLLDPGLGPPTYLTSDGRILWEDDIWGVKGTRADAIAAIFAGIGKTRVEELRQLVPERLPDALDCVECRGSGRYDANGQAVDVDGKKLSWICMSCAGLGWRSPALVLEETVLDAS